MSLPLRVSSPWLAARITTIPLPRGAIRWAAAIGKHVGTVRPPARATMEHSMRRLGRRRVTRHRGAVIACVMILASLLTLSGGHQTVLTSLRESVTSASSIPQMGSLASVSCSSAQRCIAVGYQIVSKPMPLAESWNGKAWTVMAIPMPSGAVSGSLSGVSCAGANACLAVGSYATQAQQKSGNAAPLAEMWNGKNWKITAALLPKHTSSASLVGASCSSAQACVAVGFSGPARGGSALAESWNGKIWTVKATPIPKGSVSGSLSGVSCSTAHACVAVGYSATEAELKSSSQEPLAEVWDGATWKDTSAPPSDSLLSGVSCTSAEACVAVGDQSLGSSEFQTVADQWNGKTWRAVPIPSLMNSSTLGALSCHAADACVTVGSYDTNEAYATLTEAWNGAKWNLLVTPNPASAASSLDGVSCWSADSCMAVGRYVGNSQLSSGDSVPLTEGWNGTAWTISGGIASGAVIHAGLKSSPSTIWTANRSSATSRLTATFTDGTKPVKGLQVKWHTTAGKLSATSTLTGSNGTTSVTLTQPADVEPFATVAVTATDAQATGTYGSTDVTFLPNSISIFPGIKSKGPWEWTAACPFNPAVGGGGCTNGDPNLGDVHVNGDLWNLGGSASGVLSMGSDPAGTLKVDGSFSAAPAVASNTWVRGYPSSSYGINLGYQASSPPQAPSLRLPMQIDDIPSDLVATTAYSLSSTSPLTYDVSYDMWLNPSKGMTDKGHGTIELMVWADDSGANSYPPGTPVSETVPYSVGGVASGGVDAWDMYLSHIGTGGQTGASRGPAFGTVYFVPKSPLGVGAGQHLSIDLSDVFADLAAVLQGKYGWTNFASTYWLDTIPFGAEFGPGGSAGAGAADFSLDLSTYCFGVGVTVYKPAC